MTWLEMYGSGLATGIAQTTISNARQLTASLATRRDQLPLEVGVCMALGAGRAHIRNLVLQQGMLSAVIGVSIGVCAAFGLARFIASFLFGVTAWDPTVFLCVPLLLLSAALLAVGLPARRAMRIDPMRVLRNE